MATGIGPEQESATGPVVWSRLAGDGLNLTGGDGRLRYVTVCPRSDRKKSIWGIDRIVGVNGDRCLR